MKGNVIGINFGVQNLGQFNEQVLSIHDNERFKFIVT